jgi:hypothetical protein
MKWLYGFIISCIILSCSKKEQKSCTLKIKFECTPTLYFDTLVHILITDNFSVIDGKDERNTFEKLFSKINYTYRKNIPKNPDGFFYFDSIPKSKYRYFYIDVKLGGANYYGNEKDIDLTKEPSDTIEKTICIKPIMTIQSN